MSENQVETAVTEAQPSTPAPATTPPVDVEAIKKAARAEALREAQAAKDRELARVHKQYQTREKELRTAAATRLQKAGYDESALNDFDTVQKARQFDELQAEYQQAQEWQRTVDVVAEGYGLDANDPRLADAASLPDLRAKAAAAMKEDAVKAREAAAKEAEAARKAAAQAKVDNGDLETLGGAPSAPRPGLEEQYKKEMLAAKGQGLAKGREIRDKYRAQGVDVDYIPLR